MKKIIIVATIMAASVSTSGADDADNAEPTVRRIEGLEWQRTKLAAPKQELESQLLSERQVTHVPAAVLPPLVAYERQDGTIEIRHAPEAQVKQSPEDDSSGEQE